MTEREGPTEERLAIGRSIAERIRSETNNEYAHFSGDEDEDVFAALYLTERDGCLPGRFVGDDLLLDIRALYYQVFDGIREELEARLGRHDFIWVAVDPSYEDSTTVVMCTDEIVLLMYWGKAWNFHWENEDEIAAELGRMYGVAAARLAPTAERQDGPGV